ncbi:hypothetical protein [Methyloceanibacter caenitepidi]|uniref:Uncharacterized protein n=1 Tax=Methyloceanibacter caenitepidi TaxID=1384459 RepID=A0A0A8K6X7_9HYPH|nr:hypothetical protein [Methyloceanibacter caenitepidi]BAQ18675.1 hypothetical protein GL4_3244 [Methyloceanibacter caenitepidi]
MDLWNILEYAAWGISGLLLLWMLFDALQVNRDFSEDLLTSSREGELESESEKHELT